MSGRKTTPPNRMIDSLPQQAKPMPMPGRPLEKIITKVQDAKSVLTGSLTNYYLVKVPNPQRESQAPYTAECEDIIEALSMTFNEANIFKAIWRSASARMGNGKPDHKAKYDAEKIVHYAKRNMRQFD